MTAPTPHTGLVVPINLLATTGSQGIFSGASRHG